MHGKGRAEVTGEWSKLWCRSNFRILEADQICLTLAGKQFKRNSRRLRERARDKSVIHTTYAKSTRDRTHGAITNLTASFAIRVLSRTACAISDFPIAFVRPSNANSIQAISIRTSFEKEKRRINWIALIGNWWKKHYVCIPFSRNFSDNLYKVLYWEI